MSKIEILALIMMPLLVASAILQQKTLKKLAKDMQGLSTNEAKAVEFLDRTHPELGNYLVVQVKKQVERGDQTHAQNLIDFHFTLEGSGRRVLAIVTVSTGSGQEFVSISPFVMKIPNQEKGASVGDYWLSEKVPLGIGKNIIIQSITSKEPTQNANTQKGGTPPPAGLLGGFRPYADFSDPLVEYARDFLAGEHPNLVNYRLVSAEHQLVAGVNVRLNYEGVDRYSTLTAVLGFDLKDNANLLRIQVGCAKTALNCSRIRAWEYFNAVQAMLISHPQLMKYRIGEASVEDIKGFKVMITFDNQGEGLRSLVELLIEGNKFTVQSFFTYSRN